MESEVKSVSIASEIKNATKQAIERALTAVGLTAQAYSALDCPVDTGRLRNSITFITSTVQGNANGYSGEPAEPEDYAPIAKPEEGAVYIGTNVEYAKYVEYSDTQRHDNGKAHFLRDAVTGHNDEYKEIFEKYLKGT